MKPVKLIALLALLVLSSLNHASESPPLALMPYPAQVEIKQGDFVLADAITVSFWGVSESRQQLMMSQLQSLSDKVTQVESAKSAKVIIKVTNSSNSIVPELNQDEAYQLDIGHNRIQLSAPTELGALHGVQTLLQLVDWDNHRIAQVTISDQPRFPWRGLLIDSVRHFIPLEDIKRQLRGMASAKLNVLHWHLTDDQGWRFESKAYPKLQQLASDGQFYTRQQIRELVNYAALLGIRVVPELDVPGHASAIAVAYPQLISLPGPYRMERHWGVFEPLLAPSNPQVYVFVDKLVEELASLFPDPYLHIGGDEIYPLQWQQSDKIQAYMRQHNLADTQQLHTYFNQQVQQILQRHGKKMMGWDEIFDQDLPNDILIQSWRGLESISQFARQGYQGILSTGFYIDQPQPTDYHYRNDPLPQQQIIPPHFSAQTRWQQWQFSMPRLKGSAVKGIMTLIANPDQTAQIFISLNNQPVRPVSGLRQQDGMYHFALDSWMGPMQFDLDLQNPKQLSGRIMLGNSPYPVAGKLLTKGQGANSAPQLEFAQPMNAQQAKNILGGEAALWAEILTADNLDLRIWPRLYAIAERLWSPASLTDPRQMYQRLQQIEYYANKVVGLLPQQQQRAGLQKLVGNADIQPLLVFSQALEPAQYYTRHHIKFTQDLYHQQADLNQFVDFLPVESLTLVKLKQAIQDYARGDKTVLDRIEQQLTAWQHNLPKVKALIASHQSLQGLAPIATKLATTIKTGHQLVAQCRSGQKLSTQAYQQTRQQLWQLTEVEQEMVVAAAIMVEQLMVACNG
ncbi:family 20 glycosylhydrolase [Neptunicella sp. SCSIO 80796]|uniref:family 20 glycosylhydrolase n=1 Tax=Neptunicella plasticusilytica TaxID=3117012 RepID=UPI003A4E0C42